MTVNVGYGEYRLNVRYMKIERIWRHVSQTGARGKLRMCSSSQISEQSGFRRNRARFFPIDACPLPTLEAVGGELPIIAKPSLFVIHHLHGIVALLQLGGVFDF